MADHVSSSGEKSKKTAPHSLKHEAEETTGKQRYANVHLVHEEIHAPCHFWVGFSKPGDLNPHDLMLEDKISQIFASAATKGVTDPGPLMMTNSELDPPRYVYLLPAPTGDVREKTTWVADLAKTIRQWTPPATGFYLAPEIMAIGSSAEILQSVLRELILTTKTSDYYLLLGAHSTNAVLNTALRVRSDLEQESINVCVYH